MGIGDSLRDRLEQMREPARALSVAAADRAHERAEKARIAKQLKKAKQRKAAIIGGSMLGGIVVLGVVALVIVGVTQSNPKPSPASVVSAPTAAQPTSSPTPISATSVASAAEVVAGFQNELDARAATGNQYVKGATVTFANGVVTVSLNLSPTILSFHTYDNYARVVSNAIAFNDDLGQRLRTAVTSVTTVNTDGSALGSMSVADLYKMGTGNDYSPGK